MSFTTAAYPPLSTISYISTLTSVTFNPASITGCQLWLDGADATTLTLTGANITTWSDKSGSANHMNTLAPSSGTGLWPTVGTSINGRSTVKFLSLTGIKQSTTLNGVKNLFWVGRIAAPDSGTGGQYYFLLGHDSSYEWCGNSYGSTFLDTAYAQSGIYNASPTSLFTPDARAITNATFSSVYLPTSPNVSLLSVAGITGSTAYQGLCYDRTAHNGWCGDLAEVIIYSTALTTTQREQVEGYLAWKWGLQTYLPGAHPYYSISPNGGSTSTLTSTITLNLAGYIQSGINYILKPQIPLTITPYYTAFNPISLSTLALWIDGADPLGTGITPTQGTLLSSLKDKSGNNRAISTFSTTVGFPTYKTAANGSLGAIELVAGNGIFLSSIALTPSMSLYLVYSPINPGSGMAIEQGVNAQANPGFLLTSVSTISTVFTIGGGGGGATVATGGTVTPSGAYKIHTFTTTGNTNFILTSPASITAQVLVVAGGGSGGSAYVGGGGGAGGAVYNATFTITAGTYTVTVGTGGVRTTTGVGYVGPSGVNSSFSSITGTGGGGGGSYANVAATNGGCGGGGPFNSGQFGTGSQGGNGAPYGTDGVGGYNCGGGGGGMGGTAPTPSGVRPSGGAGATYTVAGTAYTLAGGGGAGSDGQGGLGQAGGGLGGNGGQAGQTPSSGADATANTGSGGGGGGGNTGSLYGGAGGSGIVIIAYLA